MMWYIILDLQYWQKCVLSKELFVDIHKKLFKSHFGEFILKKIRAKIYVQMYSSQQCLNIGKQITYPKKRLSKKYIYYLE